MTLQERITQRILVLDGAMGTMIQTYGLTEEDFRGERFVTVPGLMKGNNDILNLTRPDIIADIHRRYLEAGADIIETNTFSSQRISMDDYNVADVCRDIVAAGCRLARAAADEYTRRDPSRPRFVAGSVGPTNKALSISPDVNDPALRSITFDELTDAFTEQMTTMLEEGVDALLIETIFDTLNAKAAIQAANKAMEATGRNVPIMLSVTVSDAAGRTLSGQTIEAFLASITYAQPFSVGINCSFGAAQLKPFLRRMADAAPCYISAYPNAGLPNALGQYDQTPEEMGRQIQEYIDEGLVNIIGGCCGTTDDFIRQFATLAAQSSARIHKIAQSPKNLQLTGLELLSIPNPAERLIRIGERCNVAGSRKFLRLINEKNYDEALLIARKQVEDGADILDVNMDDGLLDAKQEMKTFVNLIMSDPDIARVPLMIDSSDFEVITTALKCVQGKCIVNSISLKEGETRFIEHARVIRSFGAAVVVMAFDEEGQATTYDRKISICERAYHILTEQCDFPPYDIIFDPNVLAVATGIEEHNTYGSDFIRATEWIRTNLKGAHVSGGISNLSFSFRGNNPLRKAMHAIFLNHTTAVGQDMAIINPSASLSTENIPSDLKTAIDDVLLNRRSDATERLVALASEYAPAVSEKKVADSPSTALKSVSDRLQHALVTGDTSYLNSDLDAAVAEYGSAVAVIEKPLMNAMNYVGQLFANGQMFLPQVVKTARTMKQAVTHLQPIIEKEHSGNTTKAGRVLLATVKGDVHDIGKNIVSVILACNNYEVIDLGVMVPPEEIVSKAIEHNVDIIGLSGLITPSLEEMVNVALALEERHLHIPIMIGGATTSQLHTALRIAPVYSAPVVWMKDASQNVLAASQLLSATLRQAFIDQLKQQQENLRKETEPANSAPIMSLEEARAMRPPLA